MKVNLFKTRTLSNPLEGITLTKDEQAKADEASVALTSLPHEILLVLRDGAAKEILYLDSLVDWTSGEAEELRRARFENAVIAYRATYDSQVFARVTKGQS